MILLAEVKRAFPLFIFILIPTVSYISSANFSFSLPSSPTHSLTNSLTLSILSLPLLSSPSLFLLLSGRHCVNGRRRDWFTTLTSHCSFPSLIPLYDTFIRLFFFPPLKHQFNWMICSVYVLLFFLLFFLLSCECFSKHVFILLHFSPHIPSEADADRFHKKQKSQLVPNYHEWRWAITKARHTKKKKVLCNSLLNLWYQFTHARSVNRCYIVMYIANE